MILVGDAFSMLATLPTESVQCVVTSPPYWGLRDYGTNGQLGLEKTPQEYLANMRLIFEQVRRVLKKDGTLWLNIGDTYNSSTRWSGGGENAMCGNSKNIRSDVGNAPHRKGIVEGIKPKDLVGIPWRLAFGLQEDGWYLRQDIIWHKPNPMPESVRDRCTKAHEYIFLLSKSPKYLFNIDAIKEPAKYGPLGGNAAWATGSDHTAKGWQTEKNHPKLRENKKRGEFSGKTEAMASEGRNAFRAIVHKRNKRSVWTVAPKAFKDAHFAVYPPALIEPCILAGSNEGDTVLDPFFGAGTTGLVAKKLGREYVGIEINPKYVEMAEARIGLSK